MAGAFWELLAIFSPGGFTVEGGGGDEKVRRRRRRGKGIKRRRVRLRERTRSIIRQKLTIIISKECEVELVLLKRRKVK